MKDQEIIKISKQFKKGLAIDHPQLVCWPLSAYLSSCGVENHHQDCIVTPDDDPFPYPHVVIVLDGGRILDICADNFNKKIQIYPIMPDNYKPVEINSKNPFNQ